MTSLFERIFSPEESDRPIRFLTLSVLGLALLAVSVISYLSYRSVDRLGEELFNTLEPRLFEDQLEVMVGKLSKAEASAYLYLLTREKSHQKDFFVYSRTYENQVSRLLDTSSEGYAADTVRLLCAHYTSAYQYLIQIAELAEKYGDNIFAMRLDQAISSPLATEDSLAVEPDSLMEKIRAEVAAESDSSGAVSKRILDDLLKAGKLETSRQKQVEKELNALVHKEYTASSLFKQIVKQTVLENRRNALSRTSIVSTSTGTAKTLIGTGSVVVLATCLGFMVLIVYHLDRYRMLQVRLREAKAKAEDLAQAKESFLANMSHEIRTPMHAVIGFAEQLGSTRLTPRQAEYLEPIRSAAQFLLGLINDVLDYSKLESGNFTLEQSGFRPAEILREVHLTLSYAAQRKGISLDHFADPQLPAVLLGDPLRLRQMLFNLVSNAIKFTEKGSVLISARVQGRDATGQLTVLFAVKDTGIGISDEQQQRIFHEFQQADSSTSRRYGGSGLGLSITRKLVEAHEGQISLHSTPGEGTTVQMALPLREGTPKDLPSQAEQAQEDKERLRGTRVLVADDEPYNRLLVRNILDRWGASVDEVDNGKAVIERLESARTYDVILMDVHMPEMDGVEATRHIRSVMQLRIPILALTASSSPAEHQRVLEAGMDGHLLKPFQAEELFAFLTQPRSIGPGPAAASPDEDVATVEATAEDTYTLDHLRQMARGDGAFIQRMLSLFVERTELGLTELEAALAADDRSALSGIAHRMIPPCRHLDLLGVVAQLQQLELEAANLVPRALEEAVAALKTRLVDILTQVRADIATLDVAKDV